MRAIIILLLVLIALFVIALPMLIGVQHTAQVAHAKACMLAIQKRAEVYASMNGGNYPDSCRRLFFAKESKQGASAFLPANYLGETTLEAEYLFDLPAEAVTTLLAGNVSYLKKMNKPGQIGYGSTSNRKQFVVVGFDSQEMGAVPLQGERILVFMEGRRHVLLDSK